MILLLLPGGGGGTETVSTPGSEEYRLALEEEVRALLCEMSGVRDCSVVLTLSCGYEYLYATDQRVNEYSGGKETEKTVVFATESGNQLPVPLREKQPVVCGAAVVCPGADAALCSRIASLLRALFALPDESISIQS